MEKDSKWIRLHCFVSFFYLLTPIDLSDIHQYVYFLHNFHLNLENGQYFIELIDVGRIKKIIKAE